MTGNGILQIALYFLVLLALTKPLGAYMAKVFAGERTWMHRVLRPVETLIYKVCGIDEAGEQHQRDGADRDGGEVERQVFHRPRLKEAAAMARPVDFGPQRRRLRNWRAGTSSNPRFRCLRARPGISGVTPGTFDFRGQYTA